MGGIFSTAFAKITRRAAAFTVLLVATLLAVPQCLTSCTAPAVSSPYDLPGLLEAQPQSIPSTLKGLGFEYVEAAPVGWWDYPAQLEGAPEGSTARIAFLSYNDEALLAGEMSPSLLNEGRAPSSVSLYIDCDFAMSEDEANAAMDAILAKAGFTNENYRNRTEHEWNRVTLERAGRIVQTEEGSEAGNGSMESENQAAYWDITASIDQIYDETTLCLTVSTQKAAKTDSPPRHKGDTREPNHLDMPGTTLAYGIKAASAILAPQTACASCRA